MAARHILTTVALLVSLPDTIPVPDNKPVISSHNLLSNEVDGLHPTSKGVLFLGDMVERGVQDGINKLIAVYTPVPPKCLAIVLYFAQHTVFEEVDMAALDQLEGFTILATTLCQSYIHHAT